MNNWYISDKFSVNLYRVDVVTVLRKFGRDNITGETSEVEGGRLDLSGKDMYLQSFDFDTYEDACTAKKAIDAQLRTPIKLQSSTVFAKAGM